MRLAAPTSRLVAGGVALTFDDGPDPRFTPLVLEELAAHQVTATFFLVGRNARRYPRVVADIVTAGHALGSHTWSHPDPGELSLRDLVEDVRRGRDAVEDAAGRRVTLFRPPQGHIDARVAFAVRRCGLRSWLWTHDPRDWLPGRTAEDLVAGAGPLAAGAVVLLHDGLERPADPAAADRSATVAAVAAFVAQARESNLDLVAIPEG